MTALSMICVLLVGTRPFDVMPLNALAAIVIAGVVPLADFGSLLKLLQVQCDLFTATPLVPSKSVTVTRVLF